MSEPTPAGSPNDPAIPDIPAPDSAETLPEEHAVLRRNVAARTTALLTESDAGRWPQAELEELLNYLRLEVLRQVADEEWLLFRAAHHTPDELALLRREHLELHLAVEELAEAAVTRGQVGGWSPPRLTATTRDLHDQLERQLNDEERVLANAGEAAPATASLGSRPHEWYPLTQGPVIDMDRLPGAHGVDAVLERLQNLGRGEQVEIQSSSDPSPLWRRLNRACAGDYAHTYYERGPQRWRLKITRHEDPDWSPHPYA
jgi:uncharacterized protein (DUF2249 family)